MLIAIILVFFYYLFLIPESPKWLFTWSRYDESRQNLKEVA